MADEFFLDFDDNDNIIPATTLANSPANTSSDITLKRKAQELTAIRAATEEGTLSDLYNHSLEELKNSEDPDATVEDWKRLFVADQQSVMLRNLSAAVDEDPNTLEEAIPIIQDVSSLEGIYAGKQGTQRAFTDSVGGSVESNLAEAAEVERYMWGRFGDFAEERNLMEKVWDGVTTMVGLDFQWDASDLLDVPMWEGMGGLDKVVGTYQQMTAPEQMEFIDMILPKIWEAYDDNFIKVASVLELFQDPEFRRTTGEAAALEDVGIVEVLAAPLKAIGAIKRGFSITASLKKAGDAAGAAAVDKEVREGAVDVLGGDDTLVSAQNAHVFDYENTAAGIHGATDGLSGEALDIAKRVDAEVKNVHSELADIKFVELSGLNPAEQELKQQQSIDELKKLVEGQDKTFSNAEIFYSTNKGFGVRFKVNGEDTIHLVKYQRDDAGTWAAEGADIDPNLSNVLSFVFSPEARLRSIDDTITGDVTFGGMQAARVRNQLVQVAKGLTSSHTGNPLTKSLKKKGLDKLLLAGDEQSKVFTIQELQTGVNLGGVDKTFGADEIVAYYKHVQFYRDLGALRNHTVRKTLVFAGNKTLKYFSNKAGEQRKIIGIPRKWEDVNIGSNEKVLAPQLNTSGSDYASMKDVDGLLDRGYEVVELTEARYLGNQRVRYAVVRPDDNTSIDELPRNIVNYEDGYVPRIRKPGYFYVKEVTDDKRKTVIAFQSHKAAQKYTDDLNRVQAEKLAGARRGAIVAGQAPKAVTPKQFQVFRDGELSPGESFFDQLEATGGQVFTGTRKRDSLVVGETGEALERMSALESMQSYIENVSNIMPMSEYRAGMIQRFQNTLEAIAKSQGRTDGGILDPADIRSTLTIKDDNVRKVMEQTRDYMMDHLGLMTREETMWAKNLTAIATMMEGKPLIGSKLAFNGMMRLAHSNPVGALKGAAFNAYLGWFNPRQLYIQAQNASIALSMHPIEGAKALPTAMAMRTLMGITDTKVLNSKEMASAIAKMGENPKALLKRVELFRKTGLMDSITRTGDYNQMVAGLSSGTMSGFQSLARKGQVFFREGETFSRLTTFNIALARHMKKKGYKSMDEITDGDVQGISEEALVMNMNMQAENAAAFQNNIVTGLATQFLQVQAKLIENLLPTALGGTGKWTRREKMSVLAGQLALYGTVDVPVAEDAVNYAAELLGIPAKEVQEKYPHITEMVNRGMTGTLASALGMDDVNMSEPASIIAGLDDNVIADLASALFYGNSLGFWETATGPSSGVVKRTNDALWNIVDNAKYMFEYKEFTAAELLDSVDGIASITSTWSNAKKAWHLRAYEGLLTKRGTIGVSEENIGELNAAELLAIGMGFKTNAEDAYWELNGYNHDSKQDRLESIDAMKSSFRDFQRDQDMDRLKKKWSVVLKPYNEVTRSEMADSFLRSVASGKSELDKTTMRTIKEYLINGTPLPMDVIRNLETKDGR